MKITGIIFPSFIIKRIIQASKFILLLFIFPGVAWSQYYFNYFGTNKVNYTRFDWNILESEHFEIYYYPEMRELAERSAGMAEEQYLELQNRFNHSLIKKIPMILYSSHLHFQQTNVTPYELPEGVGGFFEFFKGRVVLPSDGSTSHFRRVLRHELVHVFADSKVNRILSDHRKMTHPGPPLWFTEGLAELWSGEPDFQAEMVLRDAVINNTILPVQDFYKVEGTYYMYKLGENVLNYITETYGPHTILLLMENIWKAERFEKVVQMTIGKNYEQLSADWHYWLKKKYFPTLAANDAPAAVSEEITKEGFNSKPAFRKHEQIEEIYFVANRDGYTNIYRQILGQKKADVVIKGERSQDFETFHFFKSKIDITAGGLLAFVSKSGEKDVLYVFDTEKKQILHRYRYDDLSGLASPSWSPDGKRIAISGLNLAGNSDLYIITVSDDITDGAIEKLTNDFYDDKEPAWSPDGRFIAFSSDRTAEETFGCYNIYLYDLERNEIRHQTTGPYRDEAPSWSERGEWIAFSSNRKGTPTNIWAVPFNRVIGGHKGPKRADTNGVTPSPRALTRLTTAAFDPVWTPSGDIIFTAFESFSFNIRRLTKPLDKPLAEADTVRVPYRKMNRFWTTPQVAITEKNIRKYHKKYGLDFVQGAFQYDPVFGSGGGAQIGVTDMLGNDQYYFVVYNTGRTMDEIKTNWNFVITKVNLGQRTNFAYGVYRFRGDFIEIGDRGDLEIVDENRYGGFFQVLYPLTKFQRLDASINISRFQRGQVFGTILPVDGVLVSDFIGYTFDNSLWGPSGPLDGERHSVRLGYTSDVYRSQQNYYTAIFDIRKYFRITNRSAYAFRTMVQWNDGKNPQNFIVGGSWDLRGYPRWNLPGTRFFVVNHELRYPLLDAVNLKFPFGGFGLHQIRGAVFTDIGSVWGSQINDGRVILGYEKFDGLIGSVGTGFRVNMFNFLVLRFDFGKMFDLRDYKMFGKWRLPGNRDRFIVTRYGDYSTEGFGGRDENGDLIEKRRWSRGIFFQFWFGFDY